MIKSLLHNIAKYAMFPLSLLLVGGCHHEADEQRDVIYATIAPVRYIVEAIVGDDFAVEVLVPAGASPETFEPTPRQYIALNESVAVMSVGLIEFERSLLANLSPTSHLVELSQGARTIAGSCSHSQTEESEEHNHGIDPHIWTSPLGLQLMARNCYRSLERLYPDSLHYRQGYERLSAELGQLDVEVREMLSEAEVHSFVIHHPAYSYFARDYNLEQVAIEQDGKDPSARRIGQIIDRAREQGVKEILYQRQFPASVVGVIANDIGGEAVAVDPLSEDIVSHIREFTTIICHKR